MNLFLKELTTQIVKKKLFVLNVFKLNGEYILRIIALNNSKLAIFVYNKDQGLKLSFSCYAHENVITG